MNSSTNITLLDYSVKLFEKASKFDSRFSPFKIIKNSFFGEWPKEWFSEGGGGEEKENYRLWIYPWSIFKVRRKYSTYFSTLHRPCFSTNYSRMFRVVFRVPLSINLGRNIQPLHVSSFITQCRSRCILTRKIRFTSTLTNDTREIRQIIIHMRIKYIKIVHTKTISIRK